MATQMTATAELLIPKFMQVLMNGLDIDGDAEEQEHLDGLKRLAESLVAVVESTMVPVKATKVTKATKAKKALTAIARAVKGKLSPRGAVVEPMEPVDEEPVDEDVPAPKAPVVRKKVVKVERVKEPRKANTYSLFTAAVTCMMKGEEVPNPEFVPVVNFPATSKARVVYEENQDDLDELVDRYGEGVDLYRFVSEVDKVVDMRKDPKRRLGFNALVWGLCPEEERRGWFVGWEKAKPAAVPGVVDEMDDVE